MTTWWAARAVVDGIVRDSVVLEAADGVLTRVEPDAEMPWHARTLHGAVLPGTVNAHSHAFHRVLRGRTHRGRDSFWSWRDQMYAAASVLDPETYRLLACAVFAEMLQAGYTAVGDFHYLHHAPGGAAYANPNEMSHALAAAAEDAGIRLVLLDTLYLAGGPGVAPDATQVRFSDGAAEAWAERTAALSASGLVTHGLAVHSVRAVPPEAIAVAAQVARDRGVPLHGHVSEQPRENDESLTAYGLTPVEVLRDAGALGSDFTAVHATHLTESDVHALGGSHVCVCATTERDLADGIGPIPALRDAGAALCLGSDSHAVIDPFEESRAIEMDERLGSRRRGTFTGEELLATMTTGGSAALGLPDAGLAVGAPADFIEVDTSAVRLAGHDAANAIDALVYAATASDVRTVVVAGVERVRDGAHASIDTARELDRTIRQVMDS
ncbi:MAG: formimidoylglutamate deiminase [Actinobacteria bacterium]|nr:formimidoylglutamate deiminase [Actinomycetota bacterium]